jgi:type I restriction enzyme S subunit
MGELADRGMLALGDGYRTKRAEHGQPGFRILRAGDIQKGRIIPEGVDFVSDAYARQIGPKVSQSGDVILTTKGSVGRTSVVPSNLEPVVYSPQICYFRVLDKEALDGSYLAAWFRSPDLQEQASKLMFKSDMAPYINLRDIRSLTVPLPSRNEQRRRGELQRNLQGIFHATHAETKRLECTRDELLPLLMSGKIRVRDVENVVEGVV